MATLTFPLSRIEGHAQVVIEVEAGEVVSAHFQATEYRGFQHFVQGVPAEQMPVIVPRICGVCSTAHHIAAVGALEDVYNVTPPPVALKLRELLLLGQLIQNQATSLFLFTMPDCLGLNSIFDHSEDPKLEQFRTQFGSRSLLVRKAGTDLINAVGGQSIHPVKAVVGGMTTGVPPAEADAVSRQMKKTLPIACELFDSYWTRLLDMGNRIGTWGDNEPAYYISAGGKDRPDFASGVVQFMNPDGTDGGAFSAPEFLGRLTHRETDYSYAGKTSYKGQVIRANSLARINMFESMETTRAEKYLKRFRSDFGRPAHELLLYDLARGIELVYAIERAIRILEEPLVAAETAVAHTPQDGEGYGLVEAPRGPLIHHYRVRNGLIEKAEFIIPTVHNVMAIERALKVAAQRYVSPQKVDMELEHAVGRVVRAFDPCIACATH